MKTDVPQHPFDRLVCGPESKVRLAGAALLFAQDEYDDIQPAQYLKRLEDLAGRVRDLAPTGLEGRVEALRKVIAVEEGYRGSRNVYADPDASYLNRVIDTGYGLPIALSVIWIDIGQSLGWSIRGVGMPGHFLVCLDHDEQRVLLDPFNDGAMLSVDHCRQMLRTLFGNEFQLEPDHLEPVTTFAVLERMLGNLYTLYAQSQDWPRVARILQRTLALRPEGFPYAAELSRVLIAAGRFREAETALQRAGDLATSSEEEELVQSHNHNLRRAIGQRN